MPVPPIRNPADPSALTVEDLGEQGSPDAKPTADPLLGGHGIVGASFANQRNVSNARRTFPSSGLLTRTSHVVGPDIQVIGEGSVGDKAGLLIERTERLHALGLRTPRRTVFAESFFDGFFQRNGLGQNLRNVEITPDIQERINRGSLTADEFEVLSSVTRSYGSVPLAIRSSAAGDARGTGIYHSAFTNGRQFHLTRRAFMRVLAGYFSESAVAFRRDAKTGDGFGVMIENLVGQKLSRPYGGGLFAPVLSGFGYTSTSRGEGYVNIVPGLGGGVETRDGEKISRSDLGRFDGNLFNYIRLTRGEMLGSLSIREKRSSRLLRIGRDGPTLTRDYSGYAMYLDDGRVNETSIYFQDNIELALWHLNLNGFFDKIAAMENIFGKPQYFEWAMTLEGDQPLFWILQIADVDPRLDLLDFGNLPPVILNAHTVTGAGIKECDGIVICWNSKDVEALYEYNKTHRNYVVLFSGRLITEPAGRHFRTLEYADISHAAVVVEIPDVEHNKDPIAHFGGQMDLTGKFFGVLQRDEQYKEVQFKYMYGQEITVDGLTVYPRQVRVIASERQNRIVICDPQATDLNFGDANNVQPAVDTTGGGELEGDYEPVIHHPLPSPRGEDQGGEFISEPIETSAADAVKVRKRDAESVDGNKKAVSGTSRKFPTVRGGVPMGLRGTGPFRTMARAPMMLPAPARQA